MKYDGKVVISTALDNSGLEKDAQNVSGSLGGLENTAKKAGAAIERALNAGFSKSVENARLKVKSLEQQLEGVTTEFKLAVADGDDKSAEKLAAKRVSLYDRLEAAREKLAVEVAAAAKKEAAAEETATARKEKAEKKHYSTLSKSAKRFRTRLSGIISSAFVFNIISQGLRSMVSYFGKAITSTDEMKDAIANLKGAASVAVAPIVELLTPAIAAFTNAVAKAIANVANFISLLTGKSLEEMKQTAKTIAGIGKESKKTAKAMAGFDELNILSSDNSGSSGTAGTITPNYDFVTDQAQTDTAQIEDSWLNISQICKELFYEVLGEVSVRNIENFSASLTNLSSGWNNLMSTIGGTDFSLSDFIADALDTSMISMAGQNKMLGGLLDLIAEYRDYYAELSSMEDANIFDYFSVAAVFNDKDIWNALGEMYSGWGMATLAYMPESGIGGISKEEWENLFLPVTEEYVNLYKDLSTEAAAALCDYQSIYKKLNTKIKKIDWSSFAITEKDVEEVKSLTDELFDTIVKGNEEARQAAEDSIASLLADGLISEEDTKLALQNLDETYKSQEQLVEKNQEEILGILEKAKKEQRTLTAEENKKIEALLSESNEKTVAVISQGASDSTEIYKMLSENRGKISKQMLSQAIQYANDEYAATVKAAEDTYAASIANADKLYNELGVIDAEEYQRIKKEAEDKKNVQISKATEAKEKLIAEAQAAAGGIADAVDPETGEIKSNWEILWDNMYTKVKDTWEDIKKKCKEYINKIIEYINTPVKNINSWYSTFGTQSFFGVTVPSFSIPTIPQLAQGAVLPANKPFMAIVGDQRHGTNVEAPLSTIQEAVAAVMQDYNSANLAGHEATVAVLREILEAVLGIEIGDDTIAGAVDRYNRKMSVVRGG